MLGLPAVANQITSETALKKQLFLAMSTMHVTNITSVTIIVNISNVTIIIPVTYFHNNLD
jgi:hypothetical protein